MDGNRPERNAKRKGMHLTKKSLHKLTQSSSVEDDAEDAGRDYDDANSENSSCSIGKAGERRRCEFECTNLVYLSNIFVLQQTRSTYSKISVRR